MLRRARRHAVNDTHFQFFWWIFIIFFCYKTDSLHQTAWLFAIHHTIIFNLHNTHNIAVLTYCHPSFRSKILASFPTREKCVSDSTFDDRSNEILSFCQSILCALVPLLFFMSNIYTGCSICFGPPAKNVTNHPFIQFLYNDYVTYYHMQWFLSTWVQF